MPEYRELATNRGWKVDRIERSGDAVCLLLRRHGSSPVHHDMGFDFLDGPGLAELRGNATAREEAARVLHETGVDVLSEEVLDENRRRHLVLRRRVLRLTWLSVLSGVFSLTGLLFCLVLWREGDVRAGNVLAFVSLGTGLLCLAALPLPIRAERTRKAAVGAYKDAYERVVSAALSARSHPPE
ncbi:hypothetical protein [Actinopolyspora mortivallis]|uniref:hypothetical protein n=1 Tax=Actinopolyspora mortivallis TaxID=33906 RepID=UPI00036F8C97|nr:hypothetical protein [Actinopolyspora mortivallis]